MIRAKWARLRSSVATMLGSRPLLRARRRPRRPRARRAGCRRRRRPRPRPRRAAGRARSDRSGRADRAARRREGGRALGVEQPVAEGLGQSRRRRRWSRSRRSRRSDGRRPARSRPGAARRSRGSRPRNGSRRSGGTRTRPEAEAISITAVRPSPSRPKRATTGSPSGPVTVASRIRARRSPRRAPRRSPRRRRPSGRGRSTPRAAASDASGDRPGRLGGREAPLELVGGDDHLHGRSPESGSVVRSSWVGPSDDPARPGRAGLSRQDADVGRSRQCRDRGRLSG